MLLASVLTLSGGVWAGPSTYSPDSADASSRKDRWPQATLQAQARAEVPHDTVHIVLATEVSETSQQIVVQSLNRMTNSAMERALDLAGDQVKVRSGNYRVWPMNDKDGTISNWRGRSEITLESSDFSAASDLAAALSDLMAVASIQFSVSPQVRAAKEEDLLAQAADAFRARAQVLAEALGYSGYTLRTVELGGAGVRYEMAQRGAASVPMFGAAADSIALEGGTETISVSVHGSVFLRDEKAERDR